jgi:uncharacterized protein with HEPN domain
VRSPAELCRDILDAIERVERYAARGRQAFDNDELIQTWVVHHIEIIGEAASAGQRVLRSGSAPTAPVRGRWASPTAR